MTRLLGPAPDERTTILPMWPSEAPTSVIRVPQQAVRKSLVWQDFSLLIGAALGGVMLGIGQVAGWLP